MSYQSKIKRYLLILQMIDRSHFPCSREMINQLNECGLKVSDRQLKRDLESLRDDFGVEIIYSALQKGYFIENKEYSFPYLLKLLELSQNMELLNSYIKERTNLEEIIEFEDFDSFKGIEYLRDIAWLIKNQTQIRLRYKRFETQEVKEYIFNPYLLREYLNRWYVIGRINNSDEVRTFGLDRIISIEPMNERFKRVKSDELVSLFRNTIGINASEQDNAEEIEIVCKPYQGHLFKTLPLHRSQKILQETPDEIVFSYHLVVNFELKQRLLMMATQARVTKPARLKEEMENVLNKALIYYKS